MSIERQHSNPALQRSPMCISPIQSTIVNSKNKWTFTNNSDRREVSKVPLIRGI